MATWSFEPIGTIYSCFDDKFGTPKQSRVSPHSQAVLELNSELDVTAMLEGLASFSHLWLVWVFHANQNSTPLKKVRPPRLQGKKMGVFASRSPHRPNPIGLSVVKLDKILGHKIYLSGVDVITGTPVLDIKPYIPTWDRVNEANDGWLSEHPDTQYEVNFSALAQQHLEQLAPPHEPQQVQAAIVECLQGDPRPVPYRRLEDRQSATIKESYGFKIFGLEVKFQWQDNGFLVTQIDNTSKAITNEVGPNHSAE